MNKPEYIKIDGELYKINTDFRVALECNKIAEDENIGDYERALAIIYKLFGERGIDCQNKNKMLELAIRYISLDNKEKGSKMHSDDNFEFDFEKCIGLIKSSFKFDYGYDPFEQEYIHWYTFYNDLQNLSSSEFGTCCALNRIASILQIDTTKMKDKEASKIRQIQKELKEKYCKVKEKKMTKQQQESVIDLYKKLGLWKGA